MNFIKFNSSESEAYFNTNNKFNIILKDGTVVIGVSLLSFDGENLKTVYKFTNLDGDYWDTSDVSKICTHYVFESIEVGDGWALTCNGNKVFSGNIFGVISSKEIVDHHLHVLNNNANTYTPDNIKIHDIVTYTDYNGFRHKAIVTEVKKPKNYFDHGLIEVYMVGGEKQYFDHFTYTGWNRFLTVVEEY